MPDDFQTDSEAWETYKRVVLQSIEELKADVREIQHEIALLQAGIHSTRGGSLAVREFVMAAIFSAGVIAAIVFGVVR
jgi:hypothetical protein